MGYINQFKYAFEKCPTRRADQNFVSVCVGGGLKIRMWQTCRHAWQVYHHYGVWGHAPPPQIFKLKGSFPTFWWYFSMFSGRFHFINFSISHSRFQAKFISGSLVYLNSNAALPVGPYHIQTFYVYAVKVEWILNDYSHVQEVFILFNLDEPEECSFLEGHSQVPSSLGVSVQTCYRRVCLQLQSSGMVILHEDQPTEPLLAHCWLHISF